MREIPAALKHHDDMPFNPRLFVSKDEVAERKFKKAYEDLTSGFVECEIGSEEYIAIPPPGDSRYIYISNNKTDCEELLGLINEFVIHPFRDHSVLFGDENWPLLKLSSCAFSLYKERKIDQTTFNWILLIKRINVNYGNPVELVPVEATTPDRYLDFSELMGLSGRDAKENLLHRNQSAP